MPLSKASLALALGLIGQAVVAQAFVAQAQAQPQAKPAAAAAANANCRNTGSFDVWLDGFRKEAIAQGISQATVSAALDGITLDPGVISRDRKQGFFAQSFLAFSDKLIGGNRIKNGQARLKQHRELFAKVEKDYGVPGPVIAGLWALESDYGASMGKLPVLRALATLAYDCRAARSSAPSSWTRCSIIDRGDLVPEEMIGSWAGELGQTQFLASHYLKHAVDYDGDGRRNMISRRAGCHRLHRQLPAASRLAARRAVAAGGAGALRAALGPGRPRHQASAREVGGLGRHIADGRPLPKDAMQASLLLPMGRRGPAFLAYPNFEVYLQWNSSLIYCITVSYLGTRLAGEPPIHRGTGDIPVLGLEETKELQRLLVRRGYDVGEVDGKLGAASRAAVKAMQMKLGLPADSYPTPELLERLRGG